MYIYSDRAFVKVIRFSTTVDEVTIILMPLFRPFMIYSRSLRPNEIEDLCLSLQLYLTL